MTSKKKYFVFKRNDAIRFYIQKKIGKNITHIAFTIQTNKIR